MLEEPENEVLGWKRNRRLRDAKHVLSTEHNGIMGVPIPDCIGEYQEKLQCPKP